MIGALFFLNTDGLVGRRHCKVLNFKFVCNTKIWIFFLYVSNCIQHMFSTPPFSVRPALAAIFISTCRASRAMCGGSGPSSKRKREVLLAMFTSGIYDNLVFLGAFPHYIARISRDEIQQTKKTLFPFARISATRFYTQDVSERFHLHTAMT